MFAALVKKGSAFAALLFLLSPAPVPAQADNSPAALSIVVPSRQKPVDFEREVLPLLRESCLACHSSSEPKGELVLETPQSILKGGESGPAVVPGKPAESLLLKLAAYQDKPFMPPRNNKAGAPPLKPEHLGLLQLWIQEGATGTVSSALGPVAWQPMPPAVKAIHAVALSGDGQFVACNRANQLFVYRVPSRSLASVLSDPAIASDHHPIADRDLISSLAFSPDGSLLAAGGFRSIKLWRAAFPQPLLVLKNAAAGAPIVTASPDGKLLAAGGADGLIHLWDPSTGQRVGELAGHSATIHAMAFDSAGQHLWSAAADKSVRMWDIKSLAQIAKLDLPAEVLALVSTEKFIVTGASDHLIRLLHIEEGQIKVLREVPGHTAPVTSLAWRNDRLVSGSKDKSVRFWNPETWTPLHTLDHGDEVTSVAVSPDGKRLASGGLNHGLKLWNSDSGQLVAELKGDRIAQEFAAEKELDLQFARTEVDHFKNALKQAEEREKAETEALKKATEHRDKSVQSYNEKLEAHKKAAEGKEAAEKAKADLLASLDAAAKNKPDLEQKKNETAAALASASAKAAEVKAAYDKLAGEKDTVTRQIIDAGFRAKLSALEADEVKKTSAPEPAAAAEKIAAERKTAAETLLDTFAALKPSFDKALADKSQAETLLAQAGAQANSAQDAWAAAEKLLAEADAAKKQADERINAAAKSVSDSEAPLKLAEGVKNGAVQAFESTTLVLKKATDEVTKGKAAIQLAEDRRAQAERTLEQARKTASETEKGIAALAFSSDGKTLIYTARDGVLRTATSDSGKVLDVVPAFSSPVGSVVCLPNGAVCASSADQSIKVWAGLAPLWSFHQRIGAGDDLSPLSDRVLALKFSPDGAWLASGGGFPSRSGELKIWRTQDGSLFREFKDPHSDTVGSLDWSADQKFLASGGADKFARVFDVESGRLVRNFEGHTHHVLAVSWKRDGRTLATGGGDNVVKIWDVATGEQRRTIPGFGKEVTSVQFISGGSEALTASGDRQVKIIREDGNVVRAFGGATEFVNAASITFDGKLAAAGALDGTLRVWNGQNAELIATFEPPKPSEPTPNVASK